MDEESSPVLDTGNLGFLGVSDDGDEIVSFVSKAKKKRSQLSHIGFFQNH